MKLSRIALAATALLASAGAANAATRVYTSETGSLIDLPADTSIGLKQFDATLGTLNSVTVTLYGTLDGDVLLTSHRETEGTGTVHLEGTLTLSRPDGSTIVISTPLLDQSVTLAGGQILSFSPSASDSSSIDLTSAADLALFTGTDYVTAGLNGDGLSGWSGYAGIEFWSNLTATGYATVAYDFTPFTNSAPAVPEPATWAMMVVGIGLVGATARRRNRQAATA